MNAYALYFTAPRQIQILPVALPPPGPGEALIQTLCSAISAGTEMLIYQNRFPPDLEADSTIPKLRRPLAYPLRYGYACVGRILALGPHLPPDWIGQLVFAFHPHATHFIAPLASLLPVPQAIPPERACFLANMETAVTLVHDGAPLLGERVLVLGQGIVGLLTASLLAGFPLECLVALDRYPRRRAALAEALSSPSPLRTHDPAEPDLHRILLEFTHGGFDLTYELTGNPDALNDAIALTRFSGRIVVGSWYGQKQASLNLGGAFHRSRVRLIASQVSTIAPELSGRWDKARRLQAAWNALHHLHPERWITHRFPFDQAAQAYCLLEEHPHEALQVLLVYDSPDPRKE